MLRRRLKLLVLATCLVLCIAVAGASAATNTIVTVAGNGNGTGAPGAAGDGGPATQAELLTPVAVKALPDGGYLIFQQGLGVVRRVMPNGTIITVAGNGTSGYSGDNGPATQAQLDTPSGGTATPDGGYLIAESNGNRVRRVAPDGTISTAVGNGGAGFSGDNGPAALATVAFPYDVAVAPDGGYLIVDQDNNRIRRVDPSGVITTVAGGGGGGDNVPATTSSLLDPSGVTVTPDGGYLIADTAAHRIRRVAPDNTITTVAGTGSPGSGGDGGPATLAQLNNPTRVALTPDGGYLIADHSNNNVRLVASDGTITTVAGDGSAGFKGDGGPASASQLNNPFGVDVTPGGDYLIADASNNRVRFVDAAATPPVFSGSVPASPADNPTPRVAGTAAAGDTVTLYTNATCTGVPAGSGPAAAFFAPGLSVSVPDSSTTTFFATATDIAGFPSDCSKSSLTYVEGSLPAPVKGRSVNAVPVKGTVKVKLKGTSKFVPIESLGKQVPVGSTLDTRKGTVLMSTAGKKSGSIQKGRFSRGVFKVAQGKRKDPLVTLSMTGGGFDKCSRLARGGARKVTQAKRRRRSLFSNARGRFRSRGRNSTATVRGTEWTMTDTCQGTRTTVSRGSVSVRDLVKRKTKTVKAGHSYLARAPKAKRKRK